MIVTRGDIITVYRGVKLADTLDLLQGCIFVIAQLKESRDVWVLDNKSDLNEILRYYRDEKVTPLNIHLLEKFLTI